MSTIKRMVADAKLWGRVVELSSPLHYFAGGAGLSVSTLPRQHTALVSTLPHQHTALASLSATRVLGVF